MRVRNPNPVPRGVDKPVFEKDKEVCTYYVELFIKQAFDLSMALYFLVLVLLGFTQLKKLIGAPYLKGTTDEY